MRPLSSVAIALLAAITCSMTAKAATNPLRNPGFEDGLKGWEVKDSMSRAVAEAAHEGKMGLRIVDEDTRNGSSALSAKLPVKPDQAVTVTFWAKANADFLGVYLWFFTSGRKLITDPSQKAGAGHPLCAVKKADGDWKAYSLAAKAPAEAASVAVWIHSYSTATGAADLDDFALSGLDEGARPIAQASAPAPVSLPPRAKPPVIIITADDLRQIDGKVHPLWLRFADFIKSRNIKASIGVLSQTLEEATPAYVQCIKDWHASGQMEFWFHGWDHAVHTEDGKQFNEFSGRSYEDQKQRFACSPQLAKDKLGFAFRTFGPPGGVGSGSFDANTIKVMAEEPDMKIWLYPTPIDATGKQLAAAGKVVILDRVWDVNIEGRVGVPDFNRFVTGYAKHPDREYFVLQGHPMMWGTPGRFEEFARIIDFLIEQRAVFVTPFAYATERQSGR